MRAHPNLGAQTNNNNQRRLPLWASALELSKGKTVQEHDEFFALIKAGHSLIRIERKSSKYRLTFIKRKLGLQLLRPNRAVLDLSVEAYEDCMQALEDHLAARAEAGADVDVDMDRRGGTLIRDVLAPGREQRFYLSNRWLNSITDRLDEISRNKRSG